MLTMHSLHDRRRRANNKPHVSLPVYVPREGGKDHNIAKGSGIVGIPFDQNVKGKIFDSPEILDELSDSHYVRLYFEGNLYNAENMRKFEDRVMNAADRGVTRYPTIAFLAVTRKQLAEDFVQVGTFRYHDNEFVITDEASQVLLDRWIA